MDGTWHGMAPLGTAGLGMAGPGEAGRGKGSTPQDHQTLSMTRRAGHGGASPGEAGLGLAWQGREDSAPA